MSDTIINFYFYKQDAPIGSFVFQVVGMDPDDPFTPEGQIQYSFLKDNSNEDAFNIGEAK